jgi:hypothetical protein
MTGTTPDASAFDRPTADRIASAPLPTPRTLRRRQNVLLQLGRFAAINLKMIAIIRRGHA